MVQRQWPALPEATPQSLALWARQITQLLQGGVLAQSADLTDVVVEADIANMVEAAADLTDNALVLGDGGSRGVKTSTATYSGDLDSLAGSVVKIDARRITTGATNTPPGAAVNGSHVTTYVWDSNAARQVYYQQNSTNVWARAKASGSWGAWHRLVSVSPTSLAQGDVLYYDGTNFVRLAPGTSGQFLKTNGAAANPAWASQTVAPIAQGPLSAAATLDVALGSADMYEIDLINLLPATDAVDLNMRFSQSGSFLTGAADYGWRVVRNAVAEVDLSDSEMRLATLVGNVTGSANLKIRIYRPSAGSFRKHALFEGHALRTTVTSDSYQGGGFLLSNTNAIDGVRFLFASGNIASGYYAARSYSFT